MAKISSKERETVEKRLEKPGPDHVEGVGPSKRDGKLLEGCDKKRKSYNLTHILKGSELFIENKLQRDKCKAEKTLREL